MRPRRGAHGDRGRPFNYLVFVSASERNVFRAMVSEILASAEQVVRPLCIKPVRHEEANMMFSATVRDDDVVATPIYWVFYEARAREHVEIFWPRAEERRHMTIS